MSGVRLPDPQPSLQDSSAEEQPAVNRSVAGSIPAPGASCCSGRPPQVPGATAASPSPKRRIRVRVPGGLPRARLAQLAEALRSRRSGSGFESRGGQYEFEPSWCRWSARLPEEQEDPVRFRGLACVLAGVAERDRRQAQNLRSKGHLWVRLPLPALFFAVVAEWTRHRIEGPGGKPHLWVRLPPAASSSRGCCGVGSSRACRVRAFALGRSIRYSPTILRSISSESTGPPWP